MVQNVERLGHFTELSQTHGRIMSYRTVHNEDFVELFKVLHHEPLHPGELDLVTAGYVLHLPVLLVMVYALCYHLFVINFPLFEN